ncbi:hypothetical protein Mycch_4259 [Mycolicibacterium chubuense NBB4]|uniref:Lipoprotein n=1 Tax=Mycolicibacterium chubuense (strain NBB4) TaxID=710421 RepID=I4BNW6_MYCCN|nr:hypothetical protein [Mycolicibacterium chubuense]AFM18973.1 hypothetical protein Mycch_4259 [Mycolicibacterium chubuense NBB4]
MQPRRSFRILAGAMLTATAMTACSTSKEAAPQDASTSPTTPATGAPLSVAPAGGEFPDMSGYTEGDHRTFFSGGQRYFGIAFRSPDGQKCVSNSYRSVDDTSLRCWGPRPDKGPGTWEVKTEAGTATTIRQLQDPTPTTPPGADPTPILPARHVLTYPEAHLVCGVDEQGATACLLGDHGFVLAPTSTELF